MTETLYPDAPEDAICEWAQGSGDWEHLRDQIDALEERNGGDVIVDFRVEVFDDAG